MSKPVDQKCVDQIASFVEACAELKNEPFFGKDEKLSFRSSGNRWTFTFGDRFHFRSALISFRRLWINRSPINVLDDCVVVTDEEGVKALDVSLGKFRQQLLKP